MTAPIIDAPPLPPADPTLDDSLLKINQALRRFDVEEFPSTGHVPDVLVDEDVFVWMGDYSVLYLRLPKFPTDFLYMLVGYDSAGQRISSCEVSDSGVYALPLAPQDDSPKVARIAFAPVDRVFITEVFQIGHWGWVPSGFVRLWHLFKQGEEFVFSAGIEPSAVLRSQSDHHNGYFVHLTERGWEVVWPSSYTVMCSPHKARPMIPALGRPGIIEEQPGYRPRT